jgi:hypothetical protein
VDVEAQRVAIADGRSWTVREFAGADAVIPAEGDLIVLRAQTLYHQPLRGDQLASPTKLAEVASPYVQLAGVGDVDGDGRSDILTADSQGRTLWIRRGDALVEERGVTLQVFPALLDIDGDGVAEILRDRGDRWAAYSPAEGTP